VIQSISIILLICKIKSCIANTESTGDDLDVTGATQSDLMTLQTSATVACLPCVPGWQRVEIFTAEFPAGLWTCRACEKNQYIIDPNRDLCQQCAAGAQCTDGAFAPNDPADSVWNSTDGIYRITKCPPGYVLIRDEAEPVSDRCIPCSPDTYSVEAAVFGEKLWDSSVGNFNQYCHTCPRSRAMCSGGNDLRPIAGASNIFISS
jgi:hypothetical protein